MYETRKLLIIFVVLSLFLTANSYAQQTTTVTRIVDGDTLKVLYRGNIEKNIERLRNTNSCPGCELFYTNLRGADPTYAVLTNAYLSSANFEGTNLKNVIDLTIEQLSKVNTLYNAKLDSELLEQVKEEYPDLLEKTKEEESKPDE